MKAPTVAELIEAMRERMDAATDRPVGGFEARVMRNVLAIIERELELGQAVAEQRAALLTDFGAADDESLAEAIRSGSRDDVVPALRQRLLALAEAQLGIDNPRWL